MGAFGTIKHNGVRFIADGMTGDVEAMFDGESHVRLDLLRGIAQCAVGFRSDARIWHGTVGGTGVERAIGDHLHRADVTQTMTSGQFVSGVPAVVDGLPESLGIYASFDTQTIKPLRESANPRVDVLRHLIVAHADHAFTRSVVFGVAQQMHQLIGRTRSFVQLAVASNHSSSPTSPDSSTSTPSLRAAAEFTQPQCISALDSATGWSPATASIAASRLGVIGPQGMPEAHADHILVRVECAAFTTLLQVPTQHVERFASTACINQIEPSQRVRPLREMRVAVPQSGNHPYLRSSIRWPFRRSHRSYSPVTDSNVDRLIRTYETHVFNHTRLAHTSSFQRDVLPVPWYPAAAQ